MHQENGLWIFDEAEFSAMSEKEKARLICFLIDKVNSLGEYSIILTKVAKNISEEF